MGYHIRVVQEFLEDGREVWFAEHPTLLGCHAMGRTCMEATKNLPDACESWTRLVKQHGGVLPPEPEDTQIDVIFHECT